MNTYYLYTVQGFQKESIEDGRLFDSVSVGVIAATEEEAITKAKALVKKKKYRVSGVMEYFYDSKK